MEVYESITIMEKNLIIYVNIYIYLKTKLLVNEN